MTNEILDATLKDQDHNLRPSLLSEFIGQDLLKENLQIFINSAKLRQEPLDHTLLYGPPGLGKTTLAQIISREMGVNFKATAGPNLSKAADLAAILTNLEMNDVLFIDEIHRLSINIEEILYSAMEDFCLDLVIGEGAGARTVRINLPKFTLVGATTRLGLLSNPLRDRFGIPLRLQFYDKETLTSVVLRGASIIKADIEQKAAEIIAARSRGTPRIALRLLKRVFDFAIPRDISKDIASYALDRLEVDAEGLDSNDHRYINFIAENYKGGPVGIDTIAAALSEQRDAIEDTIEPYLMQIGFIQRTPRGRVLTEKAFKHIKGITQYQFNFE